VTAGRSKRKRGDATSTASALTVTGNARRRIRIDLATRLVFVVDMPWGELERLPAPLPGVLRAIYLSPATTRTKSKGQETDYATRINRVGLVASLVSIRSARLPVKVM